MLNQWINYYKQSLCTIYTQHSRGDWRVRMCGIMLPIKEQPENSEPKDWFIQKRGIRKCFPWHATPNNAPSHRTAPPLGRKSCLHEPLFPSFVLILISWWTVYNRICVQYYLQWINGLQSHSHSVTAAPLQTKPLMRHRTMTPSVAK